MHVSKDATQHHQKEIWKSLQLYSIYRFILATTLVILSYQNKVKPFFGQFEPSFGYSDISLFSYTSLIYLLFSLCTLSLSLIQKPRYSIQAHLALYCDIVFLLLIMHASGGIMSGMGLLLIIVAAAHSILSPGKLSFLTAALITIGLLAEYFYSASYLENIFIASSQVGLLGIIIFATSLITNFLSLKAIKNQSIIKSQAKQLASSFQLNSIIVDNMQQGVIALDKSNQIKIINQTAKKLLDINTSEVMHSLDDLPDNFQHCVFAWCLNKKNLSPVKISPMIPKVRLAFQSLGDNGDLGLLIFIHDVQAENRKAQDLKLSSLGHLTANIAHELRNPLGAASHAAQLLMESDDLTQAELSLAKMIQTNCERMNQVIKNVLSISCQKSNIKEIPLNRWVQENISHIKFPHYPKAQLSFTACDSEPVVSVDPSQLMQILVNLCENGLRYSMKKTGVPSVHIKTQYSKQNNRAFLDIIDQGDGIPEEKQEFIFEPFFTTEKSGTGLGLYLARELSQINGAHLDYQKGPQGSQFRLTFSQETPT